MAAFVSAFAPGVSFIGRTSTSNACGTSPRSVVMMAKSPSVPFMDTPAALEETMPGYVGFDPLNISSLLNVKWLQEAELKHGRICMLAIIGMITAELYTFPWYSDFPKLVIDRHDWAVQNGSMLQILIWTSFFEIMSTPAVIQMINGKNDRAPGYFGLDPLGVSKKDSAMATKEIKNGTLSSCVARVCVWEVRANYCTNLCSYFSQVASLLSRFLVHFTTLPSPT